MSFVSSSSVLMMLVRGCAALTRRAPTTIFSNRLRSAGANEMSSDPMTRTSPLAGTVFAHRCAMPNL
jgi:hypothetical protein